jgi:D-cysteine desulfhydrase family pyridoxal phosphate-dependent enzyme
VRFAHLPTPIEPMPRLSAALGGPQLWIKRDDQTGLAGGGNKARKLEFLLAAAQAHGARILMTAGAVQSNHCRQTAAAAARFGFDCVLVLAGGPPAQANGNLLLDHLLGAGLIWAGERPVESLLQEAFDQAWAAGQRPYLIPVGGSNPVGAAGYVQAMAEFAAQDQTVDRIVVASSSGGTLAGMLVGAALHGFGGTITAIRVGKYEQTEPANLARLIAETAELFGQPADLAALRYEVVDDYLGPGYGVVTEQEREAIRLFARTEGILLDPVYTGRAAAGMLDLIRRGVIEAGERVLFWHTGGVPALFAYAGELLD